MHEQIGKGTDESESVPSGSSDDREVRELVRGDPTHHTLPLQYLVSAAERAQGRQNEETTTATALPPDASSGPAEITHPLPLPEPEIQ